MKIQRESRKGLTQDVVADRMGFKSKNTVSYYETGKGEITVEFLFAYCNAVGCDYRQVLDDARAMIK